jgi:hypothetical protein
MPTAAELLAAINEKDRIVTARELLEALKKAGLPTSKSTLMGCQMRGKGPPYCMYGTRSLYRLQEGLEWAVNRMRAGISQAA